MDFRQSLTQALQNAGISQREFADMVGMSSSNINRIITGNHSAPPPPLDRLDHWADLLGLTGEAKAEFIRQGQIAHIPARVRKEVIADDNLAKRQQWASYLGSLTPAQLDQLEKLDHQLRAEVDYVFRGPEEMRRMAVRVGRQVWQLLEQDQDTLLIPGAVAMRVSEHSTTYKTTEAAELAKVKAELAQAQQDLAALAHLAAEVERLKSELARMHAAELGKPPRRPARPEIDEGFAHLDKELARHAAPIPSPAADAVPTNPQRPAG